ncbi:T9SS type A sorting domain-containing protein [Aurantibacillus circumpalustris]|uniref:T9SS type A sorting domain-containing protein n=1 Tax=Aurantibacillus circumpalustris TaxID=3036359 RepID=UPI00295C2810|nr:T9SS type A sorting domain-containing protein [Aurantibacillus circumpalustris]
MKRTFLYLFLTFLSTGSIQAQCVQTCSNYIAFPTTFTTYQTFGTNVTNSFSPNADDGYTAPVPIGFNFNFYCTTYNNLLIYSNGLIQFNIGVPSTFPSGYDAAQYIPNPSVPTILNGIVALRMDDLDPSVGGTVTYATIGVTPNQMFVVTYSNVPLFGNSTLLYSGQIVLHETTNDIDIISISSPQSPNYATLGIENETGTLGLSYTVTSGSSNMPLNQAYWAQTNTAYRFSPVTPQPPSSLTGNTVLCQGDPANYQASFITSATAYNWSLPAGWSGTSTLSSLSGYAGASGGVSVSATYSCGTSVPTVINVTVNQAPVVAINSIAPPIICSGKTITITTSGAISYTINPGGIPSTATTLTDMPVTTTIYTLTGTAPNGCISVNNPTTTVTVLETPVITVNSGTMCLGETFTVMPNGAPNYLIAGLPFGTSTPLVAGQYSYVVTGTGTNGCVSAPVVSSFTVFNLPNVGASASRSVMCTKESVILMASGADTYSWSSSSSSNATISVSPVTTTLYFVVGTDLQGCASSQSVALQVKPCTGLNELSSNGVIDVKIFPNPTNGNFDVTLNSLNEKTVIEIYNALGQLLVSEKINSLVTEFNLNSQSSGLYYVMVKNSAEQKTQIIKLIKQ